MGLLKGRSPPPRMASLPAPLKAMPKIVGEVYRDPRWRSLVASLKRQRGPLCEQCLQSHRIIIGDHIQELSDGGAAFDPLNVRLMCLPCHNTKTAKARAARAR